MAEDIRGFTDHEILCKLWDAWESHLEESQDTEIELRGGLAVRPTRGEIVGWFVGLGVVVGIVTAVL